MEEIFQFVSLDLTDAVGYAVMVMVIVVCIVVEVVEVVVVREVLIFYIGMLGMRAPVSITDYFDRDLVLLPR